MSLTRMISTLPSRFLLPSLLAGVVLAVPDADPEEGLVNFETPHVHPLDLTPDGERLLAVNTAMGTLEVFRIVAGELVHRATIPVGVDPVSVRALNDSRAWVVNQVSDSVSIVNLKTRKVIETIQTANEPADVIFAGAPLRAFVSCSEANEVLVFTVADPTAPPLVVTIEAEEPRALARSADGTEVYVGIFESGNLTTSLNGRQALRVNHPDIDRHGAHNVVSRPEGPYGGQNPAPNDGNGFKPAKNPNNGPAPPQSIIVREDDQGKWMDDNGGDWSIFVDGALAPLSRRLPGWGLPDRDVAVIDAQTLDVTYQHTLMNIVMALATNPATGQVTVVGTEATNEIRFEPNLTGIFGRVHLATFQPGFPTAQVVDLNAHLDYSTGNIPPNERELSVGDPRGIAWRGDGTAAFVAGMGSNNVIEIDSTGQRVRTIDVGEGPTGVVVDEARDRVYVLNRFSGSVTAVGLTGGGALQEVGYYDPTPAVIRLGRKLLYDTHLTSGLGQLSCASCHVDARTDRLAWDLGDPSGDAGAVHPMKGPMQTQSLQDIIRFPKMHWRGDRDDLSAFNSTFVTLMGADALFSNDDMAAFEAFLDTVHFPPNPFRNLDNTLPSTLLLPDGRTGVVGDALRGICLGCHLDGGARAMGTNIELDQKFIPPSFHGMYDRLGYWPDGPPSSVMGFGYFHDGADPLFVATRTTGFTAEMMLIEGPDGFLIGEENRKDVHAGVGQQLTIRGNPDTGETTRLNNFVSIVTGSPHAALIAKARIDKEHRGFYYTGSVYQSDRAGEVWTPAELLAEASGGNSVTWTVVAKGTEVRLGVDRDFDGVFDGDEARRVW